MYIIGMNCLGPNTSACILKDGRLLAMAEEERFTRIKTAPNAMPVNAIKYCLEQSGISLADVSCIALGWDLTIFPKKYRREVFERFPPMTSRDILMTDQVSLSYDPERVADELRFAFRSAGVFDSIPDIVYVPHHLSHAVSTFFSSGFNESLILSLDGSGELVCTALNVGKGTDIKLLQKWEMPNSIGWFYSAITEFLGFRAYTGEGKVMGLAPYGCEDMEVRKKLERFVKVTPDGYDIDATYIYFGPHAHRGKFTDKLVELLGSPHNPECVEFSQHHMNVAYEAQRLLEKAAIHLVGCGIKKMKAKQGVSNLCIAGGVAMNCKMNGVLASLDCVDDFYVFPGANDTGIALGAALWMCQEKMKIDLKEYAFDDAYWGPSYSNDQIEKVLKEKKISYEFCPQKERDAAEELDKGKFVGWFQGRMEYGARALGNRSILADPSKKGVKDRLNKYVKYREPFRPFCPSILEEKAGEYLENVKPAPFMMLAFKAKKLLKERTGAVVHVDGTVRPQLVNNKTNSCFYKLITEFEKRSGIPVVLNTSFNIRGEPIVCSPDDAVRCFYGTGLDTLFLGDFMLRKKI